jgi:hypothetical protein
MRTIQVHFLYGSKPLHKYRATEKKYFGGLHGGHVSIEVDSVDYGFGPEGKFHIFSHKNNCHSIFKIKQTKGLPVYPADAKVTTFFIPVTSEAYYKFLNIVNDYCNSTPYDYAFIGMRCAAAAQDVLGQMGVVKPRGKLKNIFTTFYPKMLRKRMFRLAREKNYRYVEQQGRKTRKWEKD